MEHPLSDDLTHKSATELVALIRAREVSPVEVVEAHLQRINQINPSLNAIVTIADDAENVGVRGAVLAAQVSTGQFDDYAPRGYFPAARVLSPDGRS